MRWKAGLTIVVVVLLVVGYQAAFVVDETQQAVVTQFGRVVDEPITEPGLNFKLPFVQHTTYFPKNLQEWDGEPGQIPTLDKTYIWVDVFARWKITDPIRFFQTVSDVLSAQSRLDDIIDPAVRNFITSYHLIEAVRKSSRKLDTFEMGAESEDEERVRQISFSIETGRKKITQMILKQAQPKLDKFGIELVDVKIKRINYVDQVRQSVYDRMIAERKRVAAKFRSEGEGEARKINGQKELDLKEIQSEAYRTAETIRGEADAEATRIYANTYSRDPEFYSFLKTLESYKKALDDKSSLVLSTESEFLKYLKGYKGTSTDFQAAGQ